MTWMRSAGGRRLSARSGASRRLQGRAIHRLETGWDTHPGRPLESTGLTGLGSGVVPPVPQSEYEGVVERALGRMEGRLRIASEERAEAARLYFLLIDRPLRQRRLLVENRTLDRGLCLATLLIEESRCRSYDDSRESLEHADLAVRVTERLDPGHYGTSLVAEISARAWAVFGNAHRLVGRLGRAEEAFEQARQYLKRGSGEPLEIGLVGEMEAALHATRGRLVEAERLLVVAALLFRQVKDRHLEGRARIKQGVLDLLRGRRESAEGRLTRGLHYLEGDREPYVAAAGQALLAASLATSPSLPAQSQAREALRQARYWLAWRQAQPVRLLVERVAALLLRGALLVNGTDLPQEVKRLVSTWPRRL